MKLALVLLLVGCASTAKPASSDDEAEPFRCQGRHAAYVVTGSIVAPEAGIRLFCEGEVPSVEEYRIGDDGTEHRRGGRISGEGWERAYGAFDNAAWENLADCANAVAAKRPAKKKAPKASNEPFYVFVVSNDDRQVSLSCKGRDLPHPFDTFRDALDAAKGELPVEEN
jgi:hypothetical protein